MNVSHQIEWIETCTKQGVDAIVLSALDPDAVVPSLKAAAEKGIKIATWDSDVQIKRASSSFRHPHRKTWGRRSPSSSAMP